MPSAPSFANVCSLYSERRDLWTKILAKSNTPEALTYDEHHSNAAIFMVAGTETVGRPRLRQPYETDRGPFRPLRLSPEQPTGFCAIPIA